jgi:hypothetical protein
MAEGFSRDFLPTVRGVEILFLISFFLCWCGDWGGGGCGEPCEEGICTIQCELQGICTIACERDLHVGAPLMSIRHLLHCNLCPSACPSFITSSLGGYSNISSAR